MPLSGVVAMIGEDDMARWHIRPTQLDYWITEWVAKHTSRTIEQPTKIATLAADERLLLAAAAGYWLATRTKGERERREANHLAANITVTALVPHILKNLVAQERPDRCIIRGKRRGIPKSGKPYDAFPSGHAMHIGAIASALSRFFPTNKPLIWGSGLVLAATRVLLLAHWPTDVLVGLGSGIAIEHLLWLLAHAPEDHSHHS